MPVSTRIHALLEKERTLIFPGVYDALGAKLVEQAGFPLTFISGYSVAATQLGLPDFGYLTQTEMVAVAKRVCSSVKILVIIDADTGYGNALNVIRTVNELIDAGATRDFFIVARTDARQLTGLDDAIRRCKQYKESGADALFVEAPRSREE